MNINANMLSFLSIVAVACIMNLSQVYGQTTNNDTSNIHQSDGSQFIINIRGISAFTESNMVALINTGNDVQAKNVDLDKAIIEPGQEKSYSPSKMIDVTIIMNTQVDPNTEVTACVLQLGSGTFSQRINCNTVYSESANAGEPQKIIVPLS
jgi:hypothetical protein